MPNAVDTSMPCVLWTVMVYSMPLKLWSPKANTFPVDKQDVARGESTLLMYQQVHQSKPDSPSSHEILQQSCQLVKIHGSITHFSVIAWAVMSCTL